VGGGGGLHWKTVGKAFKVVGGYGRGELLLLHATLGPFRTGI